MTLYRIHQTRLSTIREKKRLFLTRSLSFSVWFKELVWHISELNLWGSYNVVQSSQRLLLKDGAGKHISDTTINKKGLCEQWQRNHAVNNFTCNGLSYRGSSKKKQAVYFKRKGENGHKKLEYGCLTNNNKLNMYDMTPLKNFSTQILK